MKITAFKAIYPNFDLVASADSFFNTVKYDYPQYLDSGFFREDDESCFFILLIDSAQRKHSGILCCLDIRDFDKGKIVRHEKTLASKEQKMTNLLLQRKAMIKPVLLTHPPIEPLQVFIREFIAANKPFYKVRFEEEKQVHRIYKVHQPEKKDELRAIYAGLEKLYIADGHHRVSTSAKLDRKFKKEKDGDFNFRELLSVIFPFDQLEIHDYNRIVEILEEIDPPVFIARLSEICEIRVLKKATKPRRKHSFTMYMNHVWYGLRWKDELLEKYASKKVVLDAEIMNLEIFQKILRIRDVRSDSRIRYTEGTVGIEASIDKTERGIGRVGFFLYPLAIEDLTSAADAGKTLPPKSTWFEPRIKNGLIAKSFLS